VRRAVVSAAVALGSVLLAAGCGSGDVPSGAASTPDPGDASTPVSIARLIEAADLPPCPEAGAAPPREGGLPELTLGCLGEGSPVTLFVRPDGQLAKIHYGPFRSDREVREAIAAHLGVRL